MADQDPPDPIAYLTGEATDILRLLAHSDVEELEFERRGVRLRIRRSMAAPAPAPSGDEAAPLALQAEEDSTIVTAPVVGWFRRSATVDGPPLVDVGQTVEAGQRLAVIEAVQVVHDVIAECAGTILEVLVADGEGVGYGQPLFRIGTPQP
ncbi:MAG: acetyl-CoA carboxylase biotin carboxyl carrier protein [Dehalococcoidia bacterium]|nr:acetyl-CoA carboxylase biotin carboxyl carrier protein [Dehalococcoidia bacterium]